MIEIVFSESAESGLKIAQSYGKGRYQGGCTAVFLGKIDGRRPTAQELEAARREAEEKERRAWEEARPIGGRAGDVFSFPLALSYGEISADHFWEKRKSALKQLSTCWPEHNCAEQWISESQEKLKTVLERCSTEAVRIWTGDNPDEACGMHWMLSMLIKRTEEVRLVKLPNEEVRGDVLREYRGWGEVLPGEWSRFLEYEETLSKLQIRSRVCRWRELQEENMPLRAVVSGRLTSLNADAFDHFICMEIDRAETEFRQARIIGNVLGKYPIGVGDGFLAMRMEEMLRAGKLEILADAGEGEPSYRRILRKSKI